MTVITTVLQLLIPAKLLNSVYKGCTDPLKVDGKKFTASSERPSSYTASHAVPNSNGWRASKTDQNQWLQVDFGEKTDVKGIRTQGASYWVKTYTISYSDDGTNFKPYMNNKV